MREITTITSIGAKHWQSPTHLHKKSLEETRSRRNIAQCVKGYDSKPLDNIILNVQYPGAFPLHSRIR